MIPTNYREELRPAFLSLTSLAAKLQGVRGALVKLQTHKGDGSWPLQLASIKTPSFPTTSDFRESGGATAGPLVEALSSETHRYRTAVLDKAIALKTAEVAWLREQLKETKYGPPMGQTIVDRYEELSRDHGVASRTEGAPDVVPAVIVKEHEYLLADILPLSIRALEIVRSRHTSEFRKLEAKKVAKEAADVEMGDATNADKALEDRMMRALEERLKRAGLSDKVNFPYHVFDDYCRLHDRVFPEGLLIEGPLQGETSEPPPRRQERRSQVLREQQGRQEATQGEARFPEAPKGWLWGLEKEAVVNFYDHVFQGTVDYNKPASYPDSLMAMSAPLGTRCLLSIAPPEMVEACRFRSRVFYGPNVIVPPRLAMHVSSGLRYLLYNKPRPQLLLNAWTDFERRFKWKIHFLEQGDESRYDPDYDLHTPSYKEPPQMMPYMEIGLAAGRTFCETHIHSVEPLLKYNYKDPGLVVLAELREFLDINKYVITQTDKNLGSAVVTREWIIAGGHKLLGDEANYRKVTGEQVLEATERLVKKVKTIATKPDAYGNTVLDWFPQLSKFLCGKIPKNSEGDLPRTLEDFKFPNFYVIPKIHKTPTAYRPIVPCHSCVQEPAAKVVSKYLKQILAIYPTIISGSKDLARKLSSLQQLNANRKVYIITGDIVAFYPNIPRQEAIKVCVDLWTDYCVTRPDLVPAEEKVLVTSCLLLAAGSPLFVQFQGQFYQQINGIPMGQSCSPDIANLYGATFEEQWLRLSPDPRIVMFGRYIDDCLAIVYASTKDEALSIVAPLVYPGLTMEWSASEYSSPFLDMLLYVDRRTNRLEWKPYRKPLNHLERLPWASFHPPDVKRGTFLGEMSRLATLSSTPGAYVEALEDLRRLYVARGYPKPVLNAWIKENRLLRWRQRLATKVQSRADVLVLKSEFNPVWESFNVHELFDVMRKSWSREYYKLPWCDLEGRCALHNNTTLPMPSHIADAVDKRLKSLYKHTFSASAVVGRSQRKRRQRSDDLTQALLGDWVSDGRLTKRRRGANPVSGHDTNAQAGPGSADTRPGPVQCDEVPGESPVADDGEQIADVEPEQDVSTSCRFGGPDLPRLILESRNRPLGFLYSWEEQAGKASLVQKAVFDLYKTDIVDRRFLVSRKRTKNLYDLAAAWRASQINSLDADNALAEDQVDAWN
jgi:hypothetical protein